MSFRSPIAPTLMNVIDTSWAPQSTVYLAVAAVFLVVSLFVLKQALSSIGALMQAVATAVIITFAVTVAVAMVVVAAFATVR